MAILVSRIAFELNTLVELAEFTDLVARIMEPMEGPTLDAGPSPAIFLMFDVDFCRRKGCPILKASASSFKCIM